MIIVSQDGSVSVMYSGMCLETLEDSHNTALFAMTPTVTRKYMGEYRERARAEAVHYEIIKKLSEDDPVYHIPMD